MQRLEEELAAPPNGVTDETDKSRVVSVLAVSREGMLRAVEALRTTGFRPNGLPGAWSGADIARFVDRRRRLLRWGWPEAEAQRLAERLVRRDREQDERVSCADCQYYRPGQCGNRSGAGLSTAEVGRDLAGMLQRCPGHLAR